MCYIVINNRNLTFLVDVFFLDNVSFSGSNYLIMSPPTPDWHFLPAWRVKLWRAHHFTHKHFRQMIHDTLQVTDKCNVADTLRSWILCGNTLRIVLHPLLEQRLTLTSCKAQIMKVFLSFIEQKGSWTMTSCIEWFQKCCKFLCYSRTKEDRG